MRSVSQIAAAGFPELSVVALNVTSRVAEVLGGRGGFATSISGIEIKGLFVCGSQKLSYGNGQIYFFRSEVKLALVENIRTPFLPLRYAIFPGVVGLWERMVFFFQNHGRMNSVILIELGFEPVLSIHIHKKHPRTKRKPVYQYPPHIYTLYQ